MQRTTRFCGYVFIGALLMLLGCRDTPTEPDVTVPSSELRNTADITVPVDTIPGSDHPALYYLLFDGQNGTFDEDEAPETILEVLLEQGFALRDAWYPIVASVEVPCMAPNVHPAFVVRLEAPDEDIRELGFESDPSPNHPNCGVEEFEYYAFE